MRVLRMSGNHAGDSDERARKDGFVTRLFSVRAPIQSRITDPPFFAQGGK